MSTPASNLYALLRADGPARGILHEGQDHPPEALLQAIWQHQRIHRDKLKTPAGERVFILHPGFLNLEAGPDFRKAIVRIGNASPRNGDIEVDPRPSDWVHHRHQRNPDYDNVVLRVVWRAGGMDVGGPPVVELAGLLDDTLNALAGWLQCESATATPPMVEGRCSSPLRDLDPAGQIRLLEQAAMLRFQARAERIRARAKDAGWTQAFWEGVFRALGYKHNAWPMLRLAELRTRWHDPAEPLLQNSARLFGLSGLLPAELNGRRGDGTRQLRRLWDCWWRERDRYNDEVLPAGAWRLAGVRPANHPHRRLALAAQWVMSGDLPERVKAWGRLTGSATQLQRDLLARLEPDPDPFWSTHYSLRSGPANVKLAMLGMGRLADLAGNILLPWLWAVASQGRRRALCARIEEHYRTWPAAADNAVLKLARQRLFGGQPPRLPSRLSMQQGMLQVVRDYCDTSNSLCEGCRFPLVVERFREE